MATLTFKVTDQEARLIRSNARKERVTVSEYLRRRASVSLAPARKPAKVRCPYTGALIFASLENQPPLTTDAVRELLSGVPVTYLLDVNVLVAWGWSDHVDHERAAAWIGAARREKSTKLMTSAIPALGFVRVSVQRAGGLVTVAEATETLTGMVASLGIRHVLLADDQAIRQFPAWCSSASRTTDAHLLELAAAHGAKLATLDTGIPGAFLIPAVR